MDGLLSQVGSVAGIVVLLWGAAFAFRCEIGWHPQEGRRMRPGRRERGHSVVNWECGKCGCELKQSRLQTNAKMLKTLRSQVGISRARSKVIQLHVVRKEESA